MAIKKIGSEYREITPITPASTDEKYFCNTCGEALTKIIGSDKSSAERIFNCEKCKIIVIK
jgi:predicted SprT family Zn-dependent metalloprotease